MPPSMPDPQALDLRCRDAEWIDAPATVDAFHQPIARSGVALPPSFVHAPLVELLTADVIARSSLGLERDRSGRRYLSCETPRFGIPVGPRSLGPAASDWNMREEVAAELIDADASGSGALTSMGVRITRGLIAAAGALPLFLAPGLVYAGEGDGAVEGPQVAPVVAVQAEQPEPTEAAEPGPSGPVAEPGTTTPAPRVAPPTVTVAPELTVDPRAGLSLTGRNLWTGLHGKRVTLMTHDGNSLTAVVVAQSATELAVARSSDGLVVSVPKAEIAGVQMRAAEQAGQDTPPGARTKQDGSGLVAGGIAMVSLGGVAALSGTVMMAISPYYFYIALPVLIPGLAVIGGGVSLLTASKKKRRAYNRAWGLPEMSRVQLMPTVAASRKGGQAGLVLRF